MSNLVDITIPSPSSSTDCPSLTSLSVLTTSPDCPSTTNIPSPTSKPSCPAGTTDGNPVIPDVVIPPIILHLDKAVGGEIDISWNDVNTTGIPITGYKVYRGVGGGLISYYDSVSGHATVSYKDYNVGLGMAYSYYVKATTATFDSDQSNQVNAFIPAELGIVIISRDAYGILLNDVSDRNNPFTISETNTAWNGASWQKHLLVTSTRIFSVIGGGSGGVGTYDRKTGTPISYQGSLSPMGTMFALGNNKYALPNYGALKRLETSNDGASWSIVTSSMYSNGSAFGLDGYGVFRIADSLFYCIESNVSTFNFPVAYNMLGGAGFTYNQIGYFNDGSPTDNRWNGHCGWAPTAMKYPYLYTCIRNCGTPSNPGMHNDFLIWWDVTSLTWPIGYIDFGTTTGSLLVTCIAKRGNYLFLGYTDGVQAQFGNTCTAFVVVDITNPGSPSVLSTAYHTGNGENRVWSLTMVGNYLYCGVKEHHDSAGGSYDRIYMLIYDISNLASPNLISRTRMGMPPFNNSDPTTLSAAIGSNLADCNVGEDT